MKTLKSFFFLLAPALFLSACSSDDEVAEILPEPQAAFSFEAVTDNPQLVSFTNNSEAAEEFFWDFGDASEISTEKHPTHAYAEAGVYTVSLTAINASGEAKSSQEVQVTGLPVAAFAYETDPEDPLKVIFSNNSSNTHTYSWNFGDATGTSAEEEPTYTFAAPGTYTVTLTATGEGGTVETEMEVFVTEAQPAYSELYLLGDGSANGWNLGNPEEAFVQNSDNPFQFSLETLLQPGDIKIATYTGDWCDGDWLHPVTASQSLPGADSFVAYKGCEGPDDKWTVTEETRGRYRILVDLQAQSISFEKLTAPYSELYALGDAVPNGWNIGAPEQSFAQSELDPFVFSYQLSLTPGDFKIATYTGDWCDGDWLHPVQADAPAADGSYEAHMGCTGPDYKWRVTEETQGEYLITVNLYTGNIKFEKI